jgi:hypothetical protein
VRTGNQEPTYSVIGDYAYSYGKEVVEMFEEDGGATFYPSQKHELEVMLARNADNSPSALTIGLSKPRQNGKSYSARYYAIYMSDFEHRDVLYSAHHSTTTNKMFKALCDLFESPERYPEFASDVKKVSHVRGYEGIYFNDWIDEDGNVQKGGCIEFATRTNSGSRGGTYSVIVIDEAQELTKDQQEAMLPVMSAASDISDASKMPQQIFIGTPPSPTCKGTVFADLHDTAHSVEKGSAWWLEWSVDSQDLFQTVKDADSALECAYLTNPAMGYRISEKTILNEYETMSLDGFARERLGWWSPSVVQRIDKAIQEDAWDACKSSKMKPEGKTAYGVKFTSDGEIVCLCGAVMDADGVTRISLIEQKNTVYGLQWLADWLNARYDKASCVVIDGRNGVDVLIDKISNTWRYKGSVVKPGAKDVIAAVGTLTDAIAEKQITWYEKQDALRDSAVTSVKRPIGGGWGFGGDNSAPIEACALALWGVKNSKRNPERKMRLG